MTRAILIFLATGAYVGYVPVAPGTAGSVLGLAIARGALSKAGGHVWLAVAVFAIAFVIGCWIADRAQAVLGKHDSPHIVLDEIMGMVATMFLNPLDWIHLLIGFGLFRLFDVTKPPPASVFDKMRGGAGVMLDDLAAAVYANIALRIVTRLIV